MRVLYVIFGVVLVFSIILIASYLLLSKKQGESLFLSWQGKPGIKVLSSDSKVIVWRDGPFVYKAKKGESGTTAPYAARGRVTKTDGRTFEITNYEGSQPSKVSVKLLESGDATAISKKGEEIVEERAISYTDIKLNDKVEFHALKSLGGNLYSSLQVFLIIY